MSILVPLVLAALLILLLRRWILRRRRIRLGLPVPGPWHRPEWIKDLGRRIGRGFRRRFGRRGNRPDRRDR